MVKAQILDHRGRPIIRNQSAYEAAGHGRRASNWNAPSSGPNRVLSHNLATLRNRSRAAVRNNPWLWKAVDSLVTNEVGIGVTLRSKAEDENFRKTANDLWKVSSGQLDPEGVLNFGGIQSQCVRARRVAGEVFIRRRRRRIDNELQVPLQIQVLEAEFVPESLNRDLKNGHTIRSGIEFNRRGQRVAYWMHREHPQDDAHLHDFGIYIRVPAKDVIHHYMPTRPGQRRGEPNTARSLLSAHTFDQYEDAELLRKQTRAPFTGFLTREQYDDNDYKFDPFTGEPLDDNESPLVDVESGTILTGEPGEKLTLFDGDKTGEGFGEYARSVLLKVAAGHGLPYEIMTGDWDKVNDRLVRAILNEFHRAIEAAQDHLLIFQVCAGVWNWWVDAAVFSGKLNAPGYAGNQHAYQAMQARPHGWKYTHPEQDVNAKVKAIENRLTSREAVIDEMPGPSIEEVDEQIAEDDFQQSSEPKRPNAPMAPGLIPQPA